MTTGNPGYTGPGVISNSCEGPGVTIGKFGNTGPGVGAGWLEGPGVVVGNAGSEGLAVVHSVGKDGVVVGATALQS